MSKIYAQNFGFSGRGPGVLSPKWTRYVRDRYVSMCTDRCHCRRDICNRTEEKQQPEYPSVLIMRLCRSTVEVLTDTKHRIVSLRQQSYLLHTPISFEALAMGVAHALGLNTYKTVDLLFVGFKKTRLPALSSSSAVADRLRDASCLSVVNFSCMTTIPPAPSFISSYFGFRFTAAYN